MTCQSFEGQERERGRGEGRAGANTSLCESTEMSCGLQSAQILELSMWASRNGNRKRNTCTCMHTYAHLSHKYFKIFEPPSPSHFLPPIPLYVQRLHIFSHYLGFTAYQSAWSYALHPHLRYCMTLQSSFSECWQASKAATKKWDSPCQTQTVHPPTIT